MAMVSSSSDTPRWALAFQKLLRVLTVIRRVVSGGVVTSLGIRRAVGSASRALAECAWSPDTTGNGSMDHRRRYTAPGGGAMPPPSELAALIEVVAVAGRVAVESAGRRHAEARAVHVLLRKGSDELLHLLLRDQHCERHRPRPGVGMDGDGEQLRERRLRRRRRQLSRPAPRGARIQDAGVAAAIDMRTTRRLGATCGPSDDGAHNAPVIERIHRSPKKHRFRRSQKPATGRCRSVGNNCADKTVRPRTETGQCAIAHSRRDTNVHNSLQLRTYLELEAPAPMAPSLLNHRYHMPMTTVSVVSWLLSDRDLWSSSGSSASCRRSRCR